MNMDIDECKSRLADCQKYLIPEHVLTAQSINDLFSSITFVLHQSQSSQQGANALKRESLRIVKSLTDRLVSIPSPDVVIVTACQQFRALDRLVGGDLTIHVVVWKDLLRFVTIYPDLFKRSVDVCELYKSLWQYVRDGTKQWCQEFPTYTANQASTLDAARHQNSTNSIIKTSRLLSMLVHHMATIVSTFHQELFMFRYCTSEVISSVFGAVLYANLVYNQERTAAVSESTFDADSLLSKIVEVSFLLVYGARRPCDQNEQHTSESSRDPLDPFHWAMIQSIASPLITHEPGPGVDVGSSNSPNITHFYPTEIDKLNAPTKISNLGRLEVLLALCGCGFTKTPQEKAGLCGRGFMSAVLWHSSSSNSRPIEMARMILLVVQTCPYGLFSENEIGLILFRRIVQSLVNLLLLTSINATTSKDGGGFEEAVVVLSSWLGDPHSMVKEIGITSAVGFALSLPKAHAHALFMSFIQVLDNEECCPLFASACCDFLSRSINRGVMRQEQQLAMIQHIPESFLISDITPTSFVSSLNYQHRYSPPKFRLLFSIISPPPIRVAPSSHQDGGVTSWCGVSSLTETSLRQLKQQCSRYASTVIDILNSPASSSLTSMQLDHLVDLCIILLAPLSPNCGNGTGVAQQGMLCSAQHSEKVKTFVVRQLMMSMERGLKQRSFTDIAYVIRQYGHALCLSNWSFLLDSFFSVLRQSLVIASSTLNHHAHATNQDEVIGVFTAACLSLTRINTAFGVLTHPSSALIENASLIAKTLIGFSNMISQLKSATNDSLKIEFSHSFFVLKSKLTPNSQVDTQLPAYIAAMMHVFQSSMGNSFEDSDILKRLSNDQYHTALNPSNPVVPLELKIDFQEGINMLKRSQSVKRQRTEAKRLGEASVANALASSSASVSMNNGSAKWNGDHFNIELNQNMASYTHFDGNKLRLSFEFAIHPTSSSIPIIPCAAAEDQTVSQVSLFASIKDGVSMKVVPPPTMKRR